MAVIMNERGIGEDELTYISVIVTGVPTRNLANKKLKMRAVDPKGATYSGESCERETGQNEKGRTSSHVFQGKG
jgi:hypothetical protein